MLILTNDMAEPAQQLDINKLHNVQVVEELMQLAIESDGPKILRRIFLSNTLKTAASVLNRIHASAL